MIILGFGSIETENESIIKKRVIEALKNNESVADVLKEWNDKADVYDKMPYEEAPQRYTRIWYYDKILHFHHINRRHPFSPDGWALLKTEDYVG